MNEIGSVKDDVICWWSGGVTSAIANLIALEVYGVDRCRFIFIDTKNEDDDTYRFMKDCERLYGKEIEILSVIGDKYESIEDVWRKHKSLNVAKGAICSSELKKAVRLKWQKTNEYTYQVFGFDMDELKRCISMLNDKSEPSPIFPLLLKGMHKQDCIDLLIENKINPPSAYRMGFRNNNCLKTGCVQGGIGYWQKMRDDKPDVFNRMADMEHELTEAKGQPVTMLKDQSKASVEIIAKNRKIKEFNKQEDSLFKQDLIHGWQVFLKPHKDYPQCKDISMMNSRPVEPLMECNGTCSMSDMDRKPESINQLNFEE